MSEAEAKVMSETMGEQGDGLKLVPVAESIRYRKRAQAAEKENEILAEALVNAKTEACQAVEQLESVKVEQKLMRKLAGAGAVDLEAAVLIAKARIEDDDSGDLDSVIGQLKKEKQYLFGGGRNLVSISSKTAAAKERESGNHSGLERAAKRAATTGNRVDLQEYLRLRRSFV